MSCRILVIDDNADLAEALATVLTICGFDTTTAYSGRLALEKARTFQPEVILLDIGLPDIDGYEVAATLRRDCSLEAASSSRCPPTNPTATRRRRSRPASMTIW